MRDGIVAVVTAWLVWYTLAWFLEMWVSRTLPPDHEPSTGWWTPTRTRGWRGPN